MFAFTVQDIVTAIALTLALFFVGKWLFDKKTAIENRKRRVRKLSNALREYGLVWIPDLLDDYVVSDYSTVITKLMNIGERVEQEGKDFVLTELEKVFDRVLVRKLYTTQGRAYIESMLDETDLTEAPQGQSPQGE